MKNTSSIDSFHRAYSFAFSVVLLILLISFAPSTELSLSTLSSNYRWRSNLINLYTTIRVNIGDKVFNGAVVGKDGWVFYTGGASIQDFQNTRPLRKNRLISVQRKLDELNTSLQEQGIKLLLVLPPNKSTVYRQYMPDEIPVLGAQSYLDQFVQQMKTSSQTLVLDLRQTLMDNSGTRELYYKTDSHWNELGAYYGYVAIMNSLASDFPMLSPDPETDFEHVYVESARDLTLAMGLQNHTEKYLSLMPKKETRGNTRKPLPKLLVFGDSYYLYLAKYMEPHFSAIKTIYYVPNKEVWSLKWIESEKPDIVIIEVVERYLEESLPLLLRN